MNGTCSRWIALFVVAVGAPGVAAAEESPEVTLKASKGASFEFRVNRESASSFESSRGEFNSKDDTAVDYRLEVRDVKENGDVVFKVTYKALKVKSERGDRRFEFDSSSKDRTGDDDAGAYLRKAPELQLTATLSNGRIRDISGFPEVESTGDQRADWRRRRNRSVASRRTLQRDLELVLSPAVLDEPLKAGKEYVMPEADDDDGERRGRRRFRGFRDRLSYKFEGKEKTGSAELAKFSLAARPRERDDNVDVKRESKGTALIGFADGLLKRLEYMSNLELQGERNGESYKSKRQAKVTVVRLGAEKPQERVTL